MDKVEVPANEPYQSRNQWANHLINSGYIVEDKTNTSIVYSKSDPPPKTPISSENINHFAAALHIMYFGGLDMYNEKYGCKFNLDNPRIKHEIETISERLKRLGLKETLTWWPLNTVTWYMNDLDNLAKAIIRISSK